MCLYMIANIGAVFWATVGMLSHWHSHLSTIMITLCTHILHPGWMAPCFSPHFGPLSPLACSCSSPPTLWCHVKILTPSLARSGVTSPLFFISLLYLVSSSIIPLTIHYRPLSIPFRTIILLFHFLSFYICFTSI